jgi:hypothetical protein
MLILVHMFLSSLDLSLTWVSGHSSFLSFFLFFNDNPIYIY